MKHKATLPVLAALLSLTATSAFAGTLTNASLTLSNTAPSQPTELNIEFTTATALDGSTLSNNLFYGRLDGLGIQTGTNLCGSTIIVTVNDAPFAGPFSGCYTFSSNGVQIILSATQTVATNSKVKIRVDQSLVTTPAAAGTYTPAKFATQLSSGTVLDAPLTNPSYTITAPTPVPTLSEWAMILFGTVLAGAAALTIHRRRQSA